METETLAVAGLAGPVVVVVAVEETGFVADEALTDEMLTIRQVPDCLSARDRAISVPLRFFAFPLLFINLWRSMATCILAGQRLRQEPKSPFGTLQFVIQAEAEGLGRRVELMVAAIGRRSGGIAENRIQSARRLDLSLLPASDEI